MVGLIVSNTVKILELFRGAVINMFLQYFLNVESNVIVLLY